MDYQKTIAYLEAFINYEKVSAYYYKESLKLERMKGFLRVIGNPQDSLRCIHVAGSKGKGSTCAFIAYILREAGFKTGLYTSPHLSDFRERIRILRQRKQGHENTRTDFEGMISKRDLTAFTEKLKSKIDKYSKFSQYGPLSFFEVYTALAFVYFRDKKTDFVVLETGLGGRLDATNTAESLVSVLTPISYEHRDKLGNTLRAIAGEKAGIIKSRSLIVISAPQKKEAIQVIRNKCRETGAKLYEIGKDVVPIVSPFIKGGTKERFSVKGIFGAYPGLKINLIGRHQVVNAVTAVAAVEALQLKGVDISVDSINRGLYNTLWPGRCEIISKKPWVVLDGAQNAASAEVLRKAVTRSLIYARLILILGMSNDKDIKGVCSRLCDLADKIILTQADNPRAANADMIEEKIVSARNLKPRTAIMKTGNVREALNLAKKNAGEKDLILIAGSLFVVGEARQLYG